MNTRLTATAATRWGYYTINGREFYTHSLAHAFHLARCQGEGSKTLRFDGFRAERRLAVAA